jgi:DNA sulfur modification protein DndD
MLIKSISLKDFQCYSGEHQENLFEFESGLNLIIGTNGQGKSKIYDAFYWVLRDKIFNSDIRDFQFTKEVKETLISDKAKKFCKLAQTLNAEVILVAKSFAGKEYRLTRIFKATKIGEDEWHSLDSSKLLVEEMKGAAWQLVTASKNESILTQVIPPHIEPYMWFQGEQVHKMMDFTESSTLARAINVLSNVSDYDRIIEIVEKQYTQAGKDFRAAQKKSTSNGEKAETFSKERATLEKHLASHKENLRLAEEAFDSSSRHTEDLVGGIGDAEARAETKVQLRTSKKNLDATVEKLDELNLGLSKKMFRDSWLLMNANETIAKFEEKFSNYSSAHQDQISLAKNDQLKLPINVPEPVFMKKMLEEQHCHVCDRKAKEGTAAFTHMQDLYDRSKSPEPKNVFKNDFSADLKKLYQNALSYGKVIEDIPTKIEGEFKNIQRLSADLKNYRNEITTIEESFTARIEDDDSESIVKAFRLHKANSERAQSDIINEKAAVDRCESSIKENDQKTKNLVSGPIAPEVELGHNLFRDLVDVSKATKVLVFEKFVQKLQDKSNELFGTMTEGNDAIKGEIQIRKNASGKYIPYLVGTDGKVLYNPNDSNIIMQKLALIMAIVGSRDVGRGNYALICDAPTSKMDIEYSMGFYKTVSKEYEQSILMTFDFAEDDKQLQDIEVATAYKIDAHFPNGDKNDRTDLSININRVA